MRFSIAAFTAIILPTALAISPSAELSPSSVDGVQGIANDFSFSAQQLGIQANNLASANAAFGGNLQANIGPALNISGAISSAVSTFWQTAFSVESKVCTIAYTVNPGTVASAQANLIASIQAQVDAVYKINAAFQATIDGLKQLGTAFVKSELEVLVTLLRAAIIAATSSVQPVSVLSTSAAALGLSGLDSIVGSLQGSVSVLARTVATLDFVLA